SAGQFFTDEALVVVRDRALDGVVRRNASLDEDAAALRPTPRAPGHLTQELKAALGSAEVREVDADVGVDDAHERHVGEVESLRDHLRPEEDVDLATAHAIEDLGVRPLGAGRIDIHARNARRGKALGEHPLNLLRAEPSLTHDSAAAAIAAAPRRLT